jgi:putative FmdB family regulatory protein
MPIYEYVCTSCKHEFEELARLVSEADAQRCPACDGTNVTRKVSVFAARQGDSRTAGAPADDACQRCGDPDGPCPWK